MAPSGAATSRAAPTGGSAKRAAPNATSNSDAAASGRPSGRAAKRVKFSDARTIETQSTNSAFTGEVNLDSFTKSREYEIRALEASMRNSKAINATRGFQEVPRFMRRRTASHNAKRLPKKLRDRARREMLADNTPDHVAGKKGFRSTVARNRLRAATAKKLEVLARQKRANKQKEAAKKTGAGDLKGRAETEGIVCRRPRPKIRQNALNDAPITAPKFKKRQRDKVWLPTHQWHAKRAKMTVPPLWGFAIPLTPTDKVYRPTHRAVRSHGVVCWDMSYMATIKMHGDSSGIEALLGIAGKSGHTATLWKKGARLLQLPIGSPSEGSPPVFQQHGPVTAVFNPLAGHSISPSTGAEPAAPSRREVLLHAHPTAFRGVWEALLTEIKKGRYKVILEDLRWEIGSILLKGPCSAEALQGVIRPYLTGSDQEGQARCFQDMGAETAVPNGAVLSLSIQDPRLQWPPRPYRSPTLDDEEDLERLRRLATWPGDSNLRPTALFDRNARHLGAYLPTQSALDRRRAAQGCGSALTVGKTDPPIPAMLLSTGNAAWTLLAPRACILPLWRSFMYYPLSTGGTPRFGGLDELRQVTLELCQPWFPADFPTTAAGLTWEREQRREREKVWTRRPKGKKVAWESLDLGAGRKGEVGSGHACAWELLGLTPGVHARAEEAASSAAAAEDTEMEDTSGRAAEAPTSERSLDDLILVTGKAFNLALASTPPTRDSGGAAGLGGPNPVPGLSLITVKVTMVARGEPKPCARIYRLPSASHYPTTQVAVPATDPSPTAPAGTLPPGLRGQWTTIAREIYERKKGGNKQHGNTKGNQGLQRMPKGVDLATRKRLLAENLLSTALPYPPPKGNKTDMGGKPLVPNEEDLIGFVTSGHFNLAMGRGSGIGHLSCAKAAEAVQMARGTAGEQGLDRLCIVRNAGESVGWLARWEAL